MSVHAKRRVAQKKGFDKQFLVILSATLLDQSHKKIGSLIDTEAEAKRVKTSLIWSKFKKTAKRPLVLITANSRRMKGEKGRSPYDFA